MVDEAAAEAQKLAGMNPKKYKDYRELLAKEKPEVVIIGTPDHWHPLVAIAAAKAGAHVYVEKPIGHTLLEGRAMVKAARAAGIVMQVGLHRRAAPHGVEAMKLLKEEKLAGKIGMAHAFVTAGSRLDQKFPDEEPPKGLDWDMWCGPAPYRPFNKALHPLRWRNFLDYANGQLGDWVHWVDQIQWYSGEQTPKVISSTGGKYVTESDADAPDTQVVQWKFDDFTAVWEHRTYAGSGEAKSPTGVYFYGKKGVFHLGWSDGWTWYPSDKNEQGRHRDPLLHKPGAQNIPELWADFVECIKTGRKPIADIELGHRSTSMAMLGMISYKLGRSIRWDGEKEQVIGDAEANKMLRREYRKPWKYPEG
jgi:predicted dehydrogenase